MLCRSLIQPVRMGGPLPADLRWRWAAASRMGTSHQRLGTRKQDAYAVHQLNHGVFCAVVSDGAGSASHGGEGAAIVCRTLVSEFRKWFDNHNALPSDEHIRCWLDGLRDRLSFAATKRDLTRRQFAATLVMLVVHGGDILALHVGDSALVGRKSGGWEAVCWPENGEFASTTYFVTDEPDIRLHIHRMPFEYDAFALFSDGLESVALEQSTSMPYPRFFDPMIRPVDAASHAGRLRDLSDALGRYLDSDRLCDRTDDDKTLILVSCQ